MAEPKDDNAGSTKGGGAPDRAMLGSRSGDEFNRWDSASPLKVRAMQREQHQMLIRSTEAAEVAADASKRSARWAMWAAVVAVAALLVAAWQFIV